MFDPDLYYFDPNDPISHLYGLGQPGDEEYCFRHENTFTALGAGAQIRIVKRLSLNLKSSYEFAWHSTEEIDTYALGVDVLETGTFSSKTSRFHAVKFLGGVTFRFKS